MFRIYGQKKVSQEPITAVTPQAQTYADEIQPNGP
jgi:hypothetical protein